MIDGFITDDEIYAAIDSVKPYGTIAWTHIQSGNPPSYTHIGVDYAIGESTII